MAESDPTSPLAIQARSLPGWVAMDFLSLFSIVFLTQLLKYFDASMFYPVNNTLVLVALGAVGMLV